MTNETILIVEDDMAMRELSVSMLQAMGATVQQAGQGSEALKILKKKDEKFDLLLTDVMLPGGMNGPEIAVEAKKICPGIKTLFMSGYTQDALKADSTDKTLLLQKPFKRSELASKITLTLLGE